MSSEYKMIKKVGREKFTFLKEYAEQRMDECRRQLEHSPNYDNVRYLQGQINEMRFFLSVLDSYMEE